MPTSPNKSYARNIPTILVIFGATGDLALTKIIPALFHLFNEQQLPDYFRVVGFSREKISNPEYRSRIAGIITKNKNIRVDKKKIRYFLGLFSHQRGFFQDRKHYYSLGDSLDRIDQKWKIRTNRLFYLAAPPRYFEIILRHLAGSNLTKPYSPKEGWARVLVEKPFGEDLATAQKLDEILGKLFEEEQVYRIDHYLAKEMIRNILSFRFSNNLFEKSSWNSHVIEKIEIKLLESIGVEERGAFYDPVGALRDVGQNHLLQMLALVAMDDPKEFTAEAIRREKADVLKTIKIPTREEIKSTSFRAQYLGYRKIKGVHPKSKTETYFKLRTFLTSPRWRGVPIILESGKRLKKQEKKIIVTFKHRTPCMCPTGSKHYKNRVIFRLEPQENITIQFWSKKPGWGMETEERTFKFIYRKDSKKAKYAEEYEKLLMDCIAGDQTLFVSTEEVRPMWRFIDPILKEWKKDRVPLKRYKANSDAIRKRAQFVEEMPYFITELKKEMGIVGLGKMGGNIARQLVSKGWRIVGYDQSSQIIKQLEKEELVGANSLDDLVSKLSPPRIIWLSVPFYVKAKTGKPARKPVKEIMFSPGGLIYSLSPGDTIIDSGNSFFEDSVVHYKKLKKKGIHFIDVGTSGGPEGALKGAALMIGGEKKTFEKLEPLFYEIAAEDGYQFFEGPGAGHFVKMVHDGIKYGMMESIAEGFAILKKAPYDLKLDKAAEVYNHGSIIESRLFDWLKGAFEEYGEGLSKISFYVKQTDSGEWTLKTAKKLGISAPAIQDAFDFRNQSSKKQSYIGKILCALRSEFGGHDVRKKK